MNWFYNNAVLPLMKGAFRLLSHFDSKIKRGLEGRKGLLEDVERHYEGVPKDRKRVWIHVSSFGELEQAKPVIEAIREKYRDAHIHLTFFSPSGYENAKGKYQIPDLITYSPFDTQTDVDRFIEAAAPDLVLFAKYDAWPNVIEALQARKIPSIIFSATIGQDSGRFLPVVRDFNRRVYSQLSKILVIRESDKRAFVKYGIDAGRIEVAGDTRFDQVLTRQIRGRQFELPRELLDGWKEKQIVVLGSAWREDVEGVAWAVRAFSQSIVWLIVPHETSETHLNEIEALLPGATRLSQLRSSALPNVLIIDSIGKLFDLYSIASIAYVGGGFGKGVHNTLEAAVWGRPVVVGPRHRKTKEVHELINVGGAFEASKPEEIGAIIAQLSQDQQASNKAGAAARLFVTANTGATRRIMSAIDQLFS
jgi:3-deoxy-D-manno-octulosonic-acid transferase